MSELVQLMYVCVCVRVLSGVYVMQHCWCMAGATQLLLKLVFWHGHLVLQVYCACGLLCALHTVLLQHLWWFHLSSGGSKCEEAGSAVRGRRASSFTIDLKLNCFMENRGYANAHAYCCWCCAPVELLLTVSGVWSCQNWPLHGAPPA